MSPRACHCRDGGRGGICCVCSPSHPDDADNPELQCWCCETERCEGLAVVVAHWPGRSLRLCQPCRERADQIAAAMGFRLTSMPLDPGPESHGVRRG